MSENAATNGDSNEAGGVRIAQTFTLIVNDAVSSAWAPISSTFTRIGNEGSATWDRAKRYWNGVLFQMGLFDPAQRGGNRINEMHKISFTSGGNSAGPDISHANW